LFANVNICSFLHATLWFNQQGRSEGQGGAITRAPIHSGGTEILRGRRLIARTPKNPDNFTRTFFNTIHFLPKDLRFEYGGAKLASCPGHHL